MVGIANGVPFMEPIAVRGTASTRFVEMLESGPRVGKDFVEPSVNPQCCKDVKSKVLTCYTYPVVVSADSRAA